MNKQDALKFIVENDLCSVKWQQPLSCDIATKLNSSSANKRVIINNSDIIAFLNDEIIATELCYRVGIEEKNLVPYLVDNGSLFKV